MIIVDIETSGRYPENHGIWQIGAVNFHNPRNTFLEEGRIDEEDAVETESLTIVGKTEAELRNKKKQSQKELIAHFFQWAKHVPIKNIVCQTFFDYDFLTIKARKYGLEWLFHYRAFDLHSIAQAIYYKKKGEFLINKEKESDFHSDMGLSNIMKLCNMKDERMLLKNGALVQEGKPHNALADAQIEAECLRRLLS